MFEAIGVTSVTEIGVSAGIVTSRNVGAAGRLGSGAGAAPLAGDGAAPGAGDGAALGAGAEAGAGTFSAAPDCGGLSREQAAVRADANANMKTDLVMFNLTIYNCFQLSVSVVLRHSGTNPSNSATRKTSFATIDERRSRP